ncbi:hypothetical protein C4D60_Mb04t15680 [Musa balbisiana]|uniref:Uncharacterized protein n=1 Tax=Musa balbisiana TaxID=52838 RepID=A0A4S8KCD6_MUSBA|nr:hypothetical protein C4D60_Mb04t15680 [Musa balbisiana]
MHPIKNSSDVDLHRYFFIPDHYRATAIVLRKNCSIGFLSKSILHFTLPDIKELYDKLTDFETYLKKPSLLHNINILITTIKATTSIIRNPGVLNI